ncbi:hypothetical protein V474_07970 [Novosphingobium barchaimii LL02]|uniref:Uncharacterized protein n=1 Tax=Novosphingobium barchaimii LL02 TaxID=1114963 RepID=A0A0J7Y9M4_9SPHN|nr:hypothetical protein [Novosphingobium barchaimii]KMS60008.1 hypothetical protein V474_07970 [Novosphingobium barchaimii LL02]
MTHAPHQSSGENIARAIRDETDRWHCLTGGVDLEDVIVRDDDDGEPVEVSRHPQGDGQMYFIDTMDRAVAHVVMDMLGIKVRGTTPSGSANLESIAGAVGDSAIRSLQIRSPLNRAIYQAIRKHNVSNMCDEDGHPYPLVDLMSNPAPSDIGTGEDEMIALADEVCSAVEAIQTDPTTATKTLHALGLLTDADVGRIGNTLAARERGRQGGQGA